MTCVPGTIPLLLAVLMMAEPATSQEAGRRGTKQPASSQEGQAADSVLRKAAADTLPPAAGAPAGKTRETRASESAASDAGTRPSTGTPPAAKTGGAVKGGAGVPAARSVGPTTPKEKISPADTTRRTKRARPVLPGQRRKEDPR